MSTIDPDSEVKESSVNTVDATSGCSQDVQDQLKVSTAGGCCVGDKEALGNVKSDKDGEKKGPPCETQKQKRGKKSKDSVPLSNEADVLQAGVIINPGVIVGSQVKGATRNDGESDGVKGHNSDVRPKSGKQKGKQKKTQDSSPMHSPREDQGSKGRPNSGRNREKYGRNENYPTDSVSKGGNRSGSGSPYRNKEHFRHGDQYSSSQGQRGQSGTPRGQNRQSQDTRGQTPQGYNAQNNASQGQNYRQNQQGRGTPKGRGDNYSPRDNQRGDRQRGKQTPRNQQNKQPTFEPYLSGEELQRGLKLGQLIQGQIRINPKNYEESYIPHPDGVSDIFICGMKDRNRALNGDIVAVFLNDRQNWKVSTSNLKDLEEKQKEQEAASTDTKSETLEPEQGDGSDSEPDVIIESEEVIDLTKNENSQSAGSKTVSAEKASGNQSDGSQSISAELSKNVQISKDEVVNVASNASDCDNQGYATGPSNNVQDLSKKLENISITSQTSGKDNSPMNQQHKKNETQRTIDRNKGQNSPASAQKKYSTLQEVLKDGSPIVKNLFSTDNKTMSNSANRVLQRTGKVVAIIEHKHSRASTGQLTLMNDRNPNVALFKPLDHRLPRIMIPMDNCPKDFYRRPDDHSNTLFICRVTDWPENSMYAQGELMRSLGEAGEIEPETEGILIENDVDYSEFTEEALSSLPVQVLPWQIPAGEITHRRDFRQQCVFTIDPATARDLDDALSCEKLDDGTYNVGVHIADVSYFLKEDTALDKRARFRATSVYLVQKFSKSLTETDIGEMDRNSNDNTTQVIPMLPRILCEELCSLNPNQDRLTFSVVWNMSETGEIYDEWFGRTVIKSCVKLSYDHAQGFIEDPERDWTEDELPSISDNYPISQIRDTVMNLDKIAKNMRKARFDEGALRLDQVKLQFTLDKDTGMPNGYMVYRQRDSNKLVEEFMLLANMAVAHKIKRHYPETSFLRRHPPPQTKMMDDLVELCSNLGFPIDPSTAGTLQKSLWRYAGNDEFTLARMQVLVSMCSKPMQNAKYFCTGCIDDEELYRHYALNVPLYTHFTSPIRRYADVMVHRKLAAALDYCSPSEQSKIVIQGIADNCNDRKTNSKRVQELSGELYFAVFVKTAGPFEERGMVMGVLDKAFDVFILKFGVTKRVYCDKLAIKDKLYTKEQKNPVLTLYWESTPEVPQGAVQRISIFTIVTCILKKGELPLQWMATIKPPKE